LAKERTTKSLTEHCGGKDLSESFGYFKNTFRCSQRINVASSMDLAGAEEQEWEWEYEYDEKETEVSLS
jgi:hypothetical protein